MTFYIKHSSIFLWEARKKSQGILTISEGTFSVL